MLTLGYLNPDLNNLGQQQQQQQQQLSFQHDGD